MLDTLFANIVQTFSVGDNALIALDHALSEVAYEYNVFVSLLHQCYADMQYRYDVTDGKIFSLTVRKKLDEYQQHH